MALGKPVVAYLREQDFGYLDPVMRAELPVMSATADTIADVMRRLMAIERRELHALGLASRAFAERWHDPRRLAAQTLADYQAARAAGTAGVRTGTLS